MDHVLRHRSASGGSLFNHWDIDSDEKLLCSILVASARPVHVALVVRNVSRRSRSRGEFACWPLDSSAENWRVEHGVFDAHLEPPHPILPAMSLLLTNAPPEVARRLTVITAA